jgi:hypothetical protein
MNKHSLVIGLLFTFLAGCATTDTQINPSNPDKASNVIPQKKSRTCNITAYEKLPDCYITESKPGDLVISNKMPAGQEKSTCKISGGDSIIDYSSSGKVLKTTNACPPEQKLKTTPATQ